MSYTLIEIDPRVLQEYPGNVRTDTGDLSGMVATMKDVGVLVPIILWQQGEHYEVLAGKRRTAAAIEAGLATVPALVTTEAFDDTTNQVRSLIENVARKDLTATEEAVGWRQLGLAGFDDVTIAKLTGVEPGRVQKGRVLADSSVAMAVTRKYDLTLEQAAVLAEFDEDKEAVKALTKTAIERPENFAHQASRLRLERQAQIDIKAETEKLAAKGIPLFEGRIAGYGDAGAKRIEDLVDAKAKPFTATSHKKCPGHAAAVFANWDGKVGVTYVCTDPAGNQHKSRWGSSDKPVPGSKEAEKASAERKAVLAGNKEWRAAEPVRREFIVQFFKRKTVPKGVAEFVAYEILGAPEDIAAAGSGRGKVEAMLTELTGIAGGTESISYDRKAGLAIVKKLAPLMALLAQVAAVNEVGMDPTAWRACRRQNAAWLKFLESQGYTLSAIEKKITAKGKK